MDDKTRTSRTSPLDRRPSGAALVLTLLGVLFSAGLSGCKSEEPRPAETTTQAPAKAPAPLPPGVDAKLLDSMLEVAKACNLHPTSGQAECRGGELQRLIVSVRKGGHAAEALPTLVHALSHEDPKVQAVAASVIGSTLRTQLVAGEGKPATVSQGQADALLKAVETLPESLARQVVPAAVHASMLSDRSSALFELLERERRPQVLTTAYRYLMTHGRLGVFDRVKKLAESPNPAFVLAALESPRYMRSWSDEEREAICPWAKGLLEHENPAISGNAASVLGNCSGSYIDALLETGEKLLRDKQFSITYVAAFRDLCSPQRRDRPDGASEQQCDRSRRLLEKVVGTSAVGGRVRAMSLNAVAFQWPDPKSLQLAKRYTDDADTHLAKAATQTVQRLEGRVGAASAKKK